MTRVLRLPDHLLDAMVAHAVLDWPIEACGVLVGDLEDPHAWRHVPMRNVAESEHTYCMDPRDQLDLVRETEASGERLAVVYHSHTHAGSTASGVDEAFAREAGAFYLILSVRNKPGHGPVYMGNTGYLCDGSGLVEVPVEITGAH